MTADREIVVGVDGSSTGWAALRWAAVEADLRRVPLRILHCAGVAFDNSWRGGPLDRLTPDHTEFERHVLELAIEHIRPAHPELVLRPELFGDSPPLALLGATRSAGLVVVGSRGMGAVTGLLIGSTALQVALHSTCPVAVIPRQTAATVGPFAGDIVVGVDGSDSSDAALAFTFAEAQRRHAGVVAVHAIDDKPGVTAESIVDPWRTKFPVTSVRTVELHQNARKALRGAAAGAQLLVVGNRGHGGFAGLLLGSVSLSVVQRPLCPVIVVRGTEAERR